MIHEVLPLNISLPLVVSYANIVCGAYVLHFGAPIALRFEEPRRHRRLVVLSTTESSP